MPSSDTSSSSGSERSASPPPSKAASSSKKRKADIAEIEVDISAPEPPSKKALRRMKKGKPVEAKEDSDTERASKKAGEKKKESKESKRSPFGVWIGNLPWSVSKEELRKFFVDNSTGDISDDAITRVHMPKPDESKLAGGKVEGGKKKFHNKGFAYVDFASAEAVEKAVELSETLLGGRRVLIKDHNSYDGRPAKPKVDEGDSQTAVAGEGASQKINGSGIGPGESKRVFLGNLSFDATEESLKEHFEKCGEIEFIKVATFEDSGKCKGFAWITFTEVEGARNAVQGFVKIPEEEDEEDEEQEESEKGQSSDEDEDEDEAAKSSKKAKKPKMRKWWVNRFLGRPLRMEFAEDAQVRYKKRFGKDRNADAEERHAQHSRPPRRDFNAADKPRREKENVRPAGSKKTEYRTEYAPRLTGGIVESKGKKTTF